MQGSIQSMKSENTNYIVIGKHQQIRNIRFIITTIVIELKASIKNE